MLNQCVEFYAELLFPFSVASQTSWSPFIVARITQQTDQLLGSELEMGKIQ